MEFIKFLVFGCTIFLAACHCRAQLILELKPVTLITQVSTHRDGNESPPTNDKDQFDKLSKEERERACKDGSENIGNGFQYSEEGQPTELQEYVVEIEQPDDRVSIEFVKAYECPTVPRTLIQVHPINERPDYDERILSVIFKTVSDDDPTLEDIMGYQIQFVEYISEALSGELQATNPRDFTKGRSLIDADDLTKKQCLQVYKKASDIMDWKKNVSLEDNESILCSKNRYYFIDDGESSDEDDDSDIAVVQAFKCGTQPEMYVHVDESGNMWFIWKKSGDRQLPHNIVGYQLQSVTEICAVPKQNVVRMLEQDIRSLRKAESSIDFNQFSSDDLLEFCRNTIRIIFGTRIKLSENAKISESEYYEMRQNPDENERLILMKAIVCPTDSPVIGHAYVHVSKRGIIFQNNVQIFVQLKGSTEARLSAWNDEYDE